MTADRPLTLGDVLANPTHPGRDVHLFLPKDQHWASSTPALVLSLEELGEEPEDVERRTGFQYALPLPTMAEIVQNVRLQVGQPTPAELCRAFLFYYDRDAFIEFNKEQDSGSGGDAETIRRE